MQSETSVQLKQVETPVPENDFIDADQSSYEEIYGIVSNKDDYSMPCLTFRSWLLGILFTILISILNQYLYYRSRSYSFSPLLALILTYPLGHFLAWTLPTKQIYIRGWFMFSLNPGHFTIKEHAVVFIMALIAANNVNTIDTIVLVQIVHLQPIKWVFGLFLVLSSQLIGYGMAGKDYFSQ
ncbi:unnamed protein product [Didymodactylos carnosus]|uniref:Uncharacterized protein n=1 Tax=Didymodactylos carnosus TaxID=1234261 RepID=A0A815X3V4_9BILA|nr:unnamed protein product [Didymodactylos carnosus]CAF4411533.1 unnamed protein product [Didymodactylos carnosus]